ncbi:MAG TPA: thiamine phosphate synthase [Nitrospiraceae bacterium]|nr:thiamine phosphate synthase [Nitrospiraceae bacterium]
MPHVDFSLYLITDRHQTLGRPLVDVVDRALHAGVRAVQLREKDLDTRALLQLGEELRSLTRERKAYLFINDRVDLAMAIGADGVHLRADSVPVAVARRLVGPDRFVGISAHSADEVTAAEADGADFVVLGPIYDTPSKRPYGDPIGLRPLQDANRRCTIPIFAIGGMTASRIGEVRRAGAFGVAVISSILSVPEVESATHHLLDMLTSRADYV